MTPTNELRFVERITLFYSESNKLKYEQKVRVLQQKWEHEPQYSLYTGFRPETVWCDVPLVKEDV